VLIAQAVGEYAALATLTEALQSAYFQAPSRSRRLPTAGLCDGSPREGRCRPGASRIA
jgi:hypothetical protein